MACDRHSTNPMLTCTTDALLVRSRVVLSRPVTDRETGIVSHMPSVRACHPYAARDALQACELFVFEDMAVLCELSRSKAGDQPVKPRKQSSSVPPVPPTPGSSAPAMEYKVLRRYRCVPLTFAVPVEHSAAGVGTARDDGSGGRGQSERSRPGLGAHRLRSASPQAHMHDSLAVPGCVAAVHTVKCVAGRPRRCLARRQGQHPGHIASAHFAQGLILSFAGSFQNVSSYVM